MMYMVVVCYNCGQLLLAKTGQKTKGCPYCGTRLILRRAKEVGSAKGSREALNLIQALKKEGRAAQNQV